MKMAMMHQPRPALHHHSVGVAALHMMAEPRTIAELPPSTEGVAAEPVEGVVCARGVCVDAEPEAPEVCFLAETGTVECAPNPDAAASQPWWPSALLLGCSVLYGTNFPLGRLMNEALPASASSSARFLMAALALAPFLPRLNPKIRGQALLCGSFTSLGYISQSISLVDTPAATVAFLGAPAWQKWPSWWGHGRPPRAPRAASEGVRLWSEGGRPWSWSNATPHQSHPFRCL